MHAEPEGPEFLWLSTSTRHYYSSKKANRRGNRRCFFCVDGHVAKSLTGLSLDCAAAVLLLLKPEIINDHKSGEGILSSKKAARQTSMVSQMEYTIIILDWAVPEM